MSKLVHKILLRVSNNFGRKSALNQVRFSTQLLSVNQSKESHLDIKQSPSKAPVARPVFVAKALPALSSNVKTLKYESMTTNCHASVTVPSQLISGAKAEAKTIKYDSWNPAVPTL